MLAAEYVEGLVVDPDVLGELELAHQARADGERGDAPVHAVIGLILGKRRSVGHPRRIIRLRFMLRAVSRGFSRRAS